MNEERFPTTFTMAVRLASTFEKCDKERVKFENHGFIQEIPSREYGEISLRQSWLLQSEAKLQEVSGKLPQHQTIGGYVELYETRDVYTEQVFCVYRFPVVGRPVKLTVPGSFYMKGDLVLHGRQLNRFYNSTMRGMESCDVGPARNYVYYGHIEKYPYQQKKEMKTMTAMWKEKITDLFTHIPTSRKVGRTMELIEFLDIDSDNIVMLYRIPTFHDKPAITSSPTGGNSTCVQ